MPIEKFNLIIDQLVRFVVFSEEKQEDFAADTFFKDNMAQYCMMMHRISLCEALILMLNKSREQESKLKEACNTTLVILTLQNFISLYKKYKDEDDETKKLINEVFNHESSCLVGNYMQRELLGKSDEELEEIKAVTDTEEFKAVTDDEDTV